MITAILPINSEIPNFLLSAPSTVHAVIRNLRTTHFKPTDFGRFKFIGNLLTILGHIIGKFPCLSEVLSEAFLVYRKFPATCRRISGSSEIPNNHFRVRPYAYHIIIPLFDISTAQFMSKSHKKCNFPTSTLAYVAKKQYLCSRF